MDAEPTLGQCFGNIIVGKGNWKRIAREKLKTQAQAQEHSTQVNIIVGATKRRCELSTNIKTKALEGSMVVTRQHRREP